MALIDTLLTPSATRHLAARLRGPGGLYNIGNLVGLASGLALAMTATPGRFSSAVVADYFAGSASAIAISVAMLIFFASGEAYYRAWANGVPHDPSLTRLGDLLSGLGALALFIGLYLVGEMILALTSGLLHAAGKFGSALTHHDATRPPRRIDPFRTAVLASRVPALVLLAIATVDGLAVSGALPIGPATLFICYLLWARADILLFRS